jgi:toxin ParE1/3/4
LRQAYEVSVSEEAERDADAIFSHLESSYARFGDNPQQAFARASQRLNLIRDSVLGLGRAPFQGTLRQDLIPGLRQVTKDQAIFYFTTDEPARRLTVLAIFFGGQDHRRHMLMRLSGEG